MATNFNKNTKIYSYIIILIWLFVLVLFTRNAYEKIQVSLDDRQIEQNNLESARQKVDRLNTLELKYSGQETEIAKYTASFTESEIISYIYAEIDRRNMWWQSVATTRSLSLKEWTVNEIWFHEANLILNLRVPNEARMKDMLNFFVRDDSKYKFFIDSFTVPEAATDAGFNVTIPLKVFYR